AFGVARRGRLLLLVAVLVGLRPGGVHYTGRVTRRRERAAVCGPCLGVIHVRLVRRQRVEVVSTAVGEEPGEESLPVEAFLTEPPEARRGRLMADRRVAGIERPVFA